MAGNENSTEETEQEARRAELELAFWLGASRFAGSLPEPRRRRPDGEASEREADTELPGMLAEWEALHGRFLRSGAGRLAATEEGRLWHLTGAVLRTLPAAWARHPSLLEMAEEKRKYPDARTIVDDLFEFAGVGLLDCLVGIHPPPLGVPAGNRTRGSLLEGVRYAVAYKKLVDDKVIPDDDPSHTIAHFYGEDPTRLGRWEKEHDPGPCYERLKNAVITHPPEFRKVAAILVIARTAKVFRNRRHRGARKREGVRV